MSVRRLVTLLLVVLTLGLILIPALRLRLRLTLGRIVACALRLRAREMGVQQDGITLVLAPHQDDEALGCGGLIARRRQAGHPVHVAFVTDGAASHAGHPTLTPADLAAWRADEARSALRLLGIEASAIHFLRAPDGELERLPPAAAAALIVRLTALLDTIRPTEVFLPLQADGSSEHTAAFRFFSQALAASSVRPRVCEFPVWARWNPLLLLRPLLQARRITCCRFPDYAALKQRAISAYRSQTEPTPPWTQPLLSRGFRDSFAAPEEFFFEF